VPAPVAEDFDPEEVEQVATVGSSPFFDFNQIHPDVWEKDLGDRGGHASGSHLIIRVVRQSKTPTHPEAFSITTYYRFSDGRLDKIWRDMEPLANVRRKIEQHTIWARGTYRGSGLKEDIDPEEVERVAQSRLKNYVVFYVDGYRSLQPIVNFREFEGFDVHDCERRWQEKYPEARIMRIEPLLNHVEINRKIAQGL
jgi:hypothetical protein